MGVGQGARRVLRGGSWNNNPRNVRVSNRNRNDPANRNDNNGLRLAQSARAALCRCPDSLRSRLRGAWCAGDHELASGPFREGRTNSLAKAAGAV